MGVVYVILRPRGYKRVYLPQWQMHLFNGIVVFIDIDSEVRNSFTTVFLIYNV